MFDPYEHELAGANWDFAHNTMGDIDLNAPSLPSMQMWLKLLNAKGAQFGAPRGRQTAPMNIGEDATSSYNTNPYVPGNDPASLRYLR